MTRIIGKVTGKGPLQHWRARPSGGSPRSPCGRGVKVVEEVVYWDSSALGGSGFSFWTVSRHSQIS